MKQIEALIEQILKDKLPSFTKKPVQKKPSKLPTKLPSNMNVADADGEGDVSQHSSISKGKYSSKSRNKRPDIKMEFKNEATGLDLHKDAVEQFRNDKELRKQFKNRMVVKRVSVNNGNFRDE